MSSRCKVFCSDCNNYRSKFNGYSFCDHPLNIKIEETPISAKLVQALSPESKNYKNDCEDYEPNLTKTLNDFTNKTVKKIIKKLIIRK